MIDARIRQRVYPLLPQPQDSWADRIPELPDAGRQAYLAEIAPGWLRRTGAFLVELLAAIPSVVYGLWGLQYLAPKVGGSGIRKGRACSHRAHSCKARAERRCAAID